MENTGNNTSFFGGPGGQKARKKERVGQLNYCEKERNDGPRTSSIVSRRTDADGQQLTTPKHVSSNDVIATSPWSDTIGAKILSICSLLQIRAHIWNFSWHCG